MPDLEAPPPLPPLSQPEPPPLLNSEPTAPQPAQPPVSRKRSKEIDEVLAGLLSPKPKLPAKPRPAAKAPAPPAPMEPAPPPPRSEERRVGKESRSRWASRHLQNKTI